MQYETKTHKIHTDKHKHIHHYAIHTSFHSIIFIVFTALHWMRAG